METNNKNVIKNALKNKKIMIIIAAVLAVAIITTLIICLTCCGKKVDDLSLAGAQRLADMVAEAVKKLG